MNMDFHVHGLLSKRKDFNEEFFMNEIYFSKVNGLNAIVLCEHFNAKDFLVIYEFLEKKYSYEIYSRWYFCISSNGSKY